MRGQPAVVLGVSVLHVVPFDLIRGWPWWDGSLAGGCDNRRTAAGATRPKWGRCGLMASPVGLHAPAVLRGTGRALWPGRPPGCCRAGDARNRWRRKMTAREVVARAEKGLNDAVDGLVGNAAA